MFVCNPLLSLPEHRKGAPLLQRVCIKVNTLTPYKHFLAEKPLIKILTSRQPITCLGSFLCPLAFTHCLDVVREGWDLQCVPEEEDGGFSMLLG